MSLLNKASYSVRMESFHSGILIAILHYLGSNKIGETNAYALGFLIPYLPRVTIGCMLIVLEKSVDTGIEQEGEGMGDGGGRGDEGKRGELGERKTICEKPILEEVKGTCGRQSKGTCGSGMDEGTTKLKGNLSKDCEEDTQCLKGKTCSLKTCMLI